MFLNIALLILGSVATLVAFGGDTWTKEAKPLLRRITARGWVSLACLVLALVIGVYKEIESASEGKAVRAERDDAKQKLATANTKLDELTADLSKTRSLLSQQTEINLLTVLSTGDPVKEGAWWLESTSESSNAKDLIEYLFSSIPQEYRDVVKARLHFHPFLGINSFVDLTYEGSKVITTYPFGQSDKNFVAPKFRVPSFLDKTMPFQEALFPRSEKNVFIMIQSLPQNADLRSAAIAFRDLARSPVIGTLSLSFERKFQTEALRNEYLKKHSAIKPVKGFYDLAEKTWRVEFAIPKGIKSKILTYWKRTIQKAYVYIYLESKARLMISSNVALGDTTQTDSSVGISFQAINKPELTIGIEEF